MKEFWGLLEIKKCQLLSDFNLGTKTRIKTSHILCGGLQRCRALDDHPGRESDSVNEENSPMSETPAQAGVVV